MIRLCGIWLSATPEVQDTSIRSVFGTKIPLEHLNTYEKLLHLQDIPDDILCRAFPTTLKGTT